MMEITAINNGLIRLSGAGATATIRINKEDATLMYLYIPEDLKGDTEFKEIISDIESAAVEAGAKKLTYVFPEDEGLIQSLKKADYSFDVAGEMLSFSTRELLASEAVKKTLRMNVPSVQAAAFEELLAFQRDEVASFLEKTSFTLEGDEFDNYDSSLSIVSYDEKYNPRAVILTSKWEKGYLVELLMGVSKKNPQYILGVCQEFASMLSELSDEASDERIYIYSCADFINALILRFLDRKYELKKEYSVTKAQKTLAHLGKTVTRNLSTEDPKELWHLEADKTMGLRNISEKSYWHSKLSLTAGKE